MSTRPVSNCQVVARGHLVRFRVDLCCVEEPITSRNLQKLNAAESETARGIASADL